MNVYQVDDDKVLNQQEMNQTLHDMQKGQTIKIKRLS